MGGPYPARTTASPEAARHNAAPAYHRPERGDGFETTVLKTAAADLRCDRRVERRTAAGAARRGSRRRPHDPLERGRARRRALAPWRVRARAGAQRRARGADRARGDRRRAGARRLIQRTARLLV